MRPNAWVGLVAIVFGVAYGIQAWGLPRARIGNPMAPVYFPLGLAVLMVLLGAIVFIIEARKGLNSDDKSKRPKFHFQSMKLILFVIVLCFLYTALFDRIGFVFSTILFLMAMLLGINGGRGKLVKNTVITLVFSFGMWYIFVNIFQISLPASPLGIF
ncbi:tripartite tricarboxylate transporter TctB family protein [Synergistaceae bacterium OttesenSCG-928-I11]|nr:tripartite tricarboxylate transporter TctB family protein [Synergistaceae bacterium OttesenSCG-928-I11]